MRKMRTLYEQDDNFKVVDKLRQSLLSNNVKDYDVSRKRDGTSCMVSNNVLYKRYDANANKGREVPKNSLACQDEPAPNGSFPVWVKVERDNTEDKYHFKAFDKKNEWPDGTYELCGPKVNGNNENLKEHVLLRHGSEKVELDDMSFDTVKKYLESNNVEGLVFRDKENTMFKIRRRDFNLKW